MFAVKGLSLNKRLGVAAVVAIVVGTMIDALTVGVLTGDMALSLGSDLASLLSFSSKTLISLSNFSASVNFFSEMALSISVLFSEILRRSSAAVGKAPRRDSRRSINA